MSEEKSPEIVTLRGGPCDGQKIPKGDATINVAHNEGYCKYALDEKTGDYHAVAERKHKD